MTARLAGLPPGELDEQQSEVYRAITCGPRATGPQVFALTDEEGRLRGPFNAMLLSPPVGLAVLVVAAAWGSAFERQAHEALGRACGLTGPELDALRAGALPDLLDPAERAALRAADALTRTGALSDQEYSETVAAWGERGLFELTTLVGYYVLLALQLRVFAGEEPQPRTVSAHHLEPESGTS
ncbi:carboxymuconolactone decarboxylase family protein [Streptomyces sp. R28]|uniref:Carboxymuconolactone decarboxylase family protein n=1 Tax=Streptomyces sp. R28 TaxID=3238628 RepID=A0AB39QGF0_9ACTN